MINVRIFKEKQLVVMCFVGEITPGNVTSFIEQLVTNPLYDPTYSSVVDLRNCTLVYALEDMRKTLEFMAGAEGFAAKRKTAYITSNAGQVVPPMLMTSGVYSFPMEVKVFSSVDAAISWLGLDDFTSQDYQQVLNSMCNC